MQDHEFDKLDKVEGRLAFAAEFLRKQREYQKRLDLALTVAGVGMWTWEMETDTLIWDARMCSLFDEPLDTEKTYKTFINKVVPEDRARVQAAIDATLKGETYDIRYKISVSDTCFRHIHARGLVHKNGGPAKMIGVCLEVASTGCC